MLPCWPGIVGDVLVHGQGAVIFYRSLPLCVGGGFVSGYGCVCACVRVWLGIVSLCVCVCACGGVLCQCVHVCVCVCVRQCGWVPRHHVSVYVCVCVCMAENCVTVCMCVCVRVAEY